MVTSEYEPPTPTEEQIQENITFLKNGQFERLNISLQFIRQHMGNKKYKQFKRMILKNEL